MARAVLEALDEDGVGEFAAAGHSMGGLVATALTELAPDRVTRLVLVNAPPSYESRTAARGRDEHPGAAGRPRLVCVAQPLQDEAESHDGIGVRAWA